jgi:large subunit ribosomal protein L16
MWRNNFKLFKQYHKFNLKGFSRKDFVLNSGKFGLKVVENGYISFKVVKAIFNFLKKRIKKNGKIWLNITPNMLFTRKPLETRMGKGKGNFDYYAVLVKKGKIIIEVEVYTSIKVKVLLQRVLKKINLKTQILIFNV